MCSRVTLRWRKRGTQHAATHAFGGYVCERMCAEKRILPSSSERTRASSCQRTPTQPLDSDPKLPPIFSTTPLPQRHAPPFRKGKKERKGRKTREYENSGLSGPLCLFTKVRIIILAHCPPFGRTLRPLPQTPALEPFATALHLFPLSTPRKVKPPRENRKCQLKIHELASEGGSLKKEGFFLASGTGVSYYGITSIFRWQNCSLLIYFYVDMPQSRTIFIFCVTNPTTPIRYYQSEYLKSPYCL